MGGGPVEITPKLTVDLLSQSLALRQELRQDYRLLPQTRCRRRSLCCSLLPEMTLFEALIAVGHPRGHGSCREDGSHEGAYPVFLDEPCGAELLFLPPRKGLPHLPGAVFRLSGVWGLWSQTRYEGEAARNRQAKKVNRRQWERLGVPLSPQVVEFQLPYCTHVEAVGGMEVNDELLLEARDRLEALSWRLGFWHEVFRDTYFADVSFLLASFSLGLHQAVVTKFSLVRDLVNTGKGGGLAHLMEEVPDVCAGLF